MANNKLTKNVFIGLGGTGQSILLETKRSLMAAHGGKVPGAIKFLAIDTDIKETLQDTSTDTSISFANNEYYRLQGDGAFKVAEGADWWPEGCTDWPFPGPGAGAKRMHGRAKLGLAIQPISRKIKSVITSCRSAGESNPDPQMMGAVRVTIVCSLAGGTGAGVWLDVANLVHRHIKAQGQDRVMAVMLLGDVFDSMSGVRNRNANTYASLRELSWVQERALPKGHPDKEYKLFGHDMRFPDTEMFKPCTLVTRTTATGEVIQNLDHLKRGVGRYLFHMCSNVGSKFYSWYDNIQDFSFYGPDGHTKKRGAFGSLGISELILDTAKDNQIVRADRAKDVLGELINSTGGSDEVDPASLDVRNFLEGNHFQEDYGRDDVIDALFDPKNVARWKTKRIKCPAEENLEQDSAPAQVKRFKSICEDTAPNKVAADAAAASHKLCAKLQGILHTKAIDLLAVPGGITRARAFFKNLEGELERQEQIMKKEEQDDSAEAEKLAKAFRKRQKSIPSSQSGFIGLGFRAKVRQDIESVVVVAREWLERTVDVRRKREAANVFQAFRSGVTELIKQIERIEDSVIHARGELSDLVERLAGARERNNFRVPLPPLKGSDQQFDSNRTAAKFLGNFIKRYIPKWLGLSWDSAKFRAGVMQFIAKETKDWDSTSIKDWLPQIDEDDGKKVEAMINRAAPLWMYNRGIIKPGSNQKLCLVTTDGPIEPPDKLKEVLEEEGFDMEQKQAQWIQAPGANFLSAIRWDFNVAPYTLDVVRNAMKAEYDNEDLWLQCPSGYHLHANWKNSLPSLEPDKSQEKRKRHWAMGLACGLITDKSRRAEKAREEGEYDEVIPARYFVRNRCEKGRIDSKSFYWWDLRSGTTHVDAKEKVIAEQSICADLDDQCIILKSKEGQVQFNDSIRAYTAKLDRYIQSIRGDSERKNSINEDLRILLDYLEEEDLQR